MNDPDSAIVYLVAYAADPNHPANMPRIDGCVFWFESNAKKHAAERPGSAIAPVRMVDINLDASTFADEIAAGEAP